MFCCHGLRAVWIEMEYVPEGFGTGDVTACGPCGLKYEKAVNQPFLRVVTACGPCGLKLAL